MGSAGISRPTSNAFQIFPGQTLTLHPFNSDTVKTVDLYNPPSKGVVIRFVGEFVTETDGDQTIQNALHFENGYWIRSVPAEGRVQPVDLMMLQDNVVLLAENVPRRMDADVPVLLGGATEAECGRRVIGQITGYIRKGPPAGPVKGTPRGRQR